VVVVGSPEPATQRCGCDPDAVFELLRRTSECSQVADQSGDPVGLMTTDVGDPVQRARRVSEGREREERRCQLARGREVEVDSADLTGSGDGEYAAAARHTSAHLRQDVDEQGTGLSRVHGPVGHGHTTAGEDGRGEERSRVGEVGLDRELLAAQRTGGHEPLAFVRPFDDDAAVAE
jgi:hypothetical protein